MPGASVGPGPRVRLRDLFRYLRPYSVQFAGATIALALTCATALVLPVLLRRVVDSVLIARDVEALNSTSLILFALVVLQSALIFLQNHLLVLLANRVTADLRADVYNHLIELPLRFFSEVRLGDIVSRVTNDVTVIRGALTEAPANLLRQGLIAVGGLVMMLFLNWRLASVILLFTPLLAAMLRAFGGRLRTLSTAVQDASADLTSVLEETLAGVSEVKTFSREGHEQTRFWEKTNLRLAALMRQSAVRALFVAVAALIGLGGLVLILWVGGHQVLEKRMTPGGLVAMMIYMGIAIGPLGDMAAQYSKIPEAVGAAERIWEILGLPAERQESPEAVDLPAVVGRVSYAKVSFHYLQGTPVLNEVSFTVEPGQVVALVGHSGMGKTTLLNLLTRVYIPETGRIAVDGHDIAGVTLSSLRRQIAVVPQEVFLFGGTIRENIAYGRPDAKDADIRGAARVACADRFIEALPRGYDTIVGRRGLTLSAGQRQRIAIARAVLKRARILVLDEATSALDLESEHWVQAGLRQLMRGQTTFVIAHRLSTVRAADRILVLEGGRIVEDGTHAQLLAVNGVYRRLHNLQFAEFCERDPGAATDA